MAKSKGAAPPDDLRECANKLRLYGLLSEWASLADEPWVRRLLAQDDDGTP